MKIFKKQIVLASKEKFVQAESPTLPAIASTTEPWPAKTDLYVTNVYCCNCSPAFHFDLAVPKTIKAEGCHATCPNCGVEGIVNGMHQVWPANRGRMW